MNYYTKIAPGIYAVVISKNGCTSLKELGMSEECSSPAYIHSWSRMCKMRDGRPKDATLCFAVWRDPVERFLSVYTNTCLDKALNTDRFFASCTTVDELINCAEVAMRFPIDQQDDHLRCQYTYYTFNQVDKVVLLEDLPDFIESLGISGFKRLNASNSSVPDISDEERQRIVRLYQEDYILLEQALKQDIVWTK